MTTKPRDRERAMFANMQNRPRKGNRKATKVPATRLRGLHARRPAHSRNRDEAQTAEEVLQPGSPELERWITSPERLDVEGIDTASKAKAKRGLFGKKPKA